MNVTEIKINTQHIKIFYCLGRWADEEEEEIERPKPIRPLGGVAIAPPPSLQEPTPEPAPVISNKLQPSSYGSSVAAKIMARYIFNSQKSLIKGTFPFQIWF